MGRGGGLNKKKFHLFFYSFLFTSTQFRRIQSWREKVMWKPRECFPMAHCIYCHGHYSVSPNHQLHQQYFWPADFYHFIFTVRTGLL